jgi:hypothetical protein
MEDVEDQLEQEQRDDDEAAKVLFIVACHHISSCIQAEP